MPYEIVNEGGKYCVKKKSGETLHCYDDEGKAKDYLSALYANVKDSEIQQFSMRIFKAAYNKADATPMKWSAIDSDIDDDLYKEKMSLELFKDFTERIENKTPVPEAFKSIICEDTWCGGMPYVSIAHYKSGSDAKNVPGTVESIYVDGTRLKSKGTLFDNDLGRAVWDSLREDLYMQKSGADDHDPVRISIGFLDLQHKHLAPQGGQEYTFTRTGIGQLCPLCEQNIGGKIYMKGQLVHLALTRVPVNPRTEMIAEKSMGDNIVTKKDDARSIIKELADELDEKSLADGTLVVRADTEASMETNKGSVPVDDYNKLCEECYDPNDGSFDQDCVNKVLVANMVELRKTFQTVKSLTDEVVEDARKKDVSAAEKKHAKKEYGDVTYADAENNKYPIDTEEHIRAAWNYIHQARNAAKYSDGGKSIKAKILSAWKRVIGGEPPSVEKSDVVEDTEMANLDANVTVTVDKAVLGGVNVPEKKFEYSANGVSISGDPQQNIIPNPVKAKQDKEDMQDNGDDEEAEGETKKKSALDATYEQLKSLVAKGASVDEINQAFASLGTEVEKSYVPKAQPVDMNSLADVIKSAVAEAVKPLQLEVAQLKAANQVQKSVVGQAPLPRSLTIRPNELLQKAQTQQAPTRKLSQIEKIARSTVGLPVEQ
jgi:hypothetical protein